MTAETKTKKKKAPADVEPAEPTFKEVLPQIEDGLQGMIDNLGSFLGNSTSATVLRAQLQRAENLAWAIQKFPTFDVSALLLSKPMEIPVAPNDPERRGDVAVCRVPVFATADIAYGGKLGGWCKATLYSYRSDFELVLNVGGQQVRHPITLDRTVEQDTEIEAQRLTMPEPVKDRLRGVHHRFDACTLVYEAEWSVRQQAKDPLVIGTIAGRHFLIDQYDLTKMESYISKEFTE